MAQQAARAAELEDVVNFSIVDILLCLTTVIEAVRSVMDALDAQHVHVAEKGVADVMLVIDFVAGIGIEKYLRQMHCLRGVDSHDGGR